MTSDKNLALQYAGRNGYLYIVDSEKATQYKQEGKKRPKINKDVFISNPTDLTIQQRFRLLDRKRKQAQEFSWAN